MKIAILEDDQAQLEFISGTLVEAGYVCNGFPSGAKLIEALRQEKYDLLILDWMVPDLSGKGVLYLTRANLAMGLPILFLTSKGMDEDVASILDAGADDYIVKPVSAPILLARVSALIRRVLGRNAPSGAEVFGDCLFDRGRGQVFFRGEAISLTAKEFDLARMLFMHLGSPLSRKQILETLWMQTNGVSAQTLSVHLSILRQKLRLNPVNGYQIRPIYGYGYRLERTEDLCTC